mmetsp:Transcript_22399/g.59053  ORF Transcript_22399/g.59053 Transcript_22399/m.59053 type:complete len:257 (+) Transcript_22399:597-1367(+)
MLFHRLGNEARACKFHQRERAQRRPVRLGPAPSARIRSAVCDAPLGLPEGNGQGSVGGSLVAAHPLQLRDPIGVGLQNLLDHSMSHGRLRTHGAHRPALEVQQRGEAQSPITDPVPVVATCTAAAQRRDGSWRSGHPASAIDVQVVQEVPPHACDGIVRKRCNLHGLCQENETVANPGWCIRDCPDPRVHIDVAIAVPTSLGALRISGTSEAGCSRLIPEHVDPATRIVGAHRLAFRIGQNGRVHSSIPEVQKRCL